MGGKGGGGMGSQQGMIGQAAAGRAEGVEGV